MGKLGLTGTSLVAAVPGAALAVLMLMAVLKNLEPMPTLLKVLALLVFLLALVMAVFPAWVLVMYRSTPYEKPASKRDAKKSAVAATAGGAALAETGAMELSSGDEFSMSGEFESAESLELDEFEPHGDSLAEGSLEEDGLGEETFDSEFDFEEFDDEKA